MAIKGALYKIIREKSKKSDATISRWATELRRKHGPMTPDEARLVIAHDLGIDLNKHSVTADERERVRTLREGGASLASVQQRTGALQPAAPPEQQLAAPEGQESRPVTRAAMFGFRSFHASVNKSSRKLFVGGHNKDAVRAAIQSVHNRVKRLSGLRDEDGQALMARAFDDKNPALQMSDLSTTSECDEHAGTRFLMMGAVRGLRNPRAHEDYWQPDEDVASVLECLAFASLLHRFLDRCEAYRQAKSA